MNYLHHSNGESYRILRDHATIGRRAANRSRYGQSFGLMSLHSQRQVGASGHLLVAEGIFYFLLNVLCYVRSGLVDLESCETLYP